jgi:nucleotide-binding universal stress UspA family protein
MFKPKKILVPTDFSEYSDRALQKALDIAQESGAGITLLHVIGQDIRECMSDYCFTQDEFERFKKGMIESGEEYLKAQLKKFSVPGTVRIDSAVLQGIPYEEILKYQSKNNFDLIIIASHGRSGIAKYLMGSVAEKVIRGATCEALVLK